MQLQIDVLYILIYMNSNYLCMQKVAYLFILSAAY